MGLALSSAFDDLLAANGILDAANRVLNLARNLVGFAFRFELRIAGDLASNFLDDALRLIGCAFDPVFVHENVPLPGGTKG